MWSIPKDILEAEILCRLSIKSLLRFKCVSKEWHCLISDPKFALYRQKKQGEIDNNNTIHQRVLVLAISPDRLQSLHCLTRCITELNFNFPFESRPNVIIGSCNGLVCMSLHGCKDFFIYNPSTRAHKKLPDPDISLGSPYLYGFGYDSCTDDYKVLAVSCLRVLLKVFSMKAFSWRDVHYNLGVKLFYGTESPPKGCLFNGALHWLVSGFHFGSQDPVIIAFDLAKEKFCRVGEACHPRSVSLGVVGGCLSLNVCCSNCVDETTDFELWVMKQYGVHSSWERLTKIDNDIMVRYHGSLVTLCTTTGTDGGDEIIMINKWREFISCNLNERTLEEIYRPYFDWCESVSYTESILSPNVL